MSNTQQIETSLKSLILDDDREFVAMLSGQWGIGKTYFWEEFTKNNLKDKDVVYISLFGQNSLSDIETAITTTLSTYQGFVKENKKVLGVLKKGTSWVSNTLGMPIDIASSAILSLFTKDSFKNVIICFDDFERLSDKVALKDVMGLISQFKEQKECKVVMILNEGELTNDKQNIFSTYKEKIVDYNFYYQPSQEELFEAIKEDIEKITFCEHQTIYDFFKKIDLKNIRIMKQVLYQLNHFDFIKDYDLNEKVINEFVEIALNLFVFKAHSNYTYSEFEDLKKYTPPDLAKKALEIVGSSTGEDFEETRNEKHDKYFWYYKHLDNQFVENKYNSINKDIIEKHVYDFIDTHTINKEEIHHLLNENNQSLSWYETRNNIVKLNTKFYTDFSVSNHEIAEQLFMLLNIHKDTMPRLFQYDKYKLFLENIKNLSPKVNIITLEKEIAENYIKFYVNNPHNDISGPFDSEDGQLDLLISYYDWATDYMKDYKNKSVKIIPEEILPLIKHVLENGHLSEDDVFKLNQLSSDDYKKQIKENSYFILPLIKFLRKFPSNDISEKIINALESLREENDDYAWKVAQIFKSSGITIEDKK